jgi:thymidine kinase
MKNSNGQLHIVMGPMFSGKTTHLLETITKYEKDNIQFIVITHVIDTRYDTYKVVSHQKKSYDAIPVTNLKQLGFMKEYYDADILFIDEAQFFNDLYEFVEHAIEIDNKRVYVYGLDGDYKREPIGEIMKIIPLADTVVKLKGVCAKCTDGTASIFSKRISKSTNQIEIGGSNEYVPVCRFHYSSELSLASSLIS